MTKQPSQATAQAHPTPPYAKGISRIDDDRKHSHGWKATIRRASAYIQRIFSDGSNGGREAAYQVAVAWVNEQFKKYPVKSRLDSIQHLRRDNRSGVSGVYRYPIDGSNPPGAHWGAKWRLTPNTLPQNRKFSIARYGEEKAKRLAIQARIQGVKVTAHVAFAELPKPIRTKKPRTP